MLLKIFKIIVLINFGLYLYNTILTLWSFKKYEKPRSMIDSFRQTFSILIPLNTMMKFLKVSIQ